MSSSERMVVSAPMSFAGAAGRTMNWLWHDKPTWLRAVVSWWAVPLLLALWWSVIVVWYVVFGLLLAPYRLLRRGSRKRKRQDKMHAETLEAIRKNAPDGT